MKRLADPERLGDTRADAPALLAPFDTIAVSDAERQIALARVCIAELVDDGVRVEMGDVAIEMMSGSPNMCMLTGNALRCTHRVEPVAERLHTARSLDRRVRMEQRGQCGDVAFVGGARVALDERAQAFVASFTALQPD